MKKTTYLKAITEAVDEEMARDPSVFVLGEDVRVWGAPYGEFAGLFNKYGPNRIFDTPVSETAIIGAAIGAATMGMRPIAHIMIAEFLGVCMSEIMNAMCKTRYMTGGQVRMPVTIMVGSGSRGGRCAAAEHSSCIDGLLMSIIGLKIAVPSTPYDVKGLIKTAIREDNPVMVICHRQLMGSRVPSDIPEDDYTIPLGKADIKREGSDVTVVGTGLMVNHALGTADRLQKRGISIEVVDPRTLAPLDNETICKSVRKTGRLVIMDEEPRKGGAGSDIAAMVAEEAFESLKAPITRVCAPDTPIPFSPPLENLWLPNEEHLIEAVTKLCS